MKLLAWQESSFEVERTHNMAKDRLIRRFFVDSFYVYIFDRRNHSWKNRVQKHPISKAETPKPSGEWHIRYSCSQTFYVPLWLFRAHWRTRLEMKTRACFSDSDFLRNDIKYANQPSHRALNVLITHQFLFSCRKLHCCLLEGWSQRANGAEFENFGLLQ